MCAVLLSKISQFYYLLSRAQSNVLTLISYILYLTLHFLLFVNCTFVTFFFLVCVCAKKCGVVCIFDFFLVFLLPLFISQRIPLQFFLIFYISKSRRYTRHRMRPVTIDVAWSLCVCLLDTTNSHAKTDEPSGCYLGCGIGLAQATMPYSSRPVQRGLCLLRIYSRKLCKNG